jgi:flagellar basal-body rod modification protein FlgD
MTGTTVTPTTTDALGLSQTETTQVEQQKLGQDDFLTLMISQLQSQDPMNPMDSEAFMGQVAQFSTVEGIQQLNDSFDELAASLVSNQVLQASQLIGHSVLIPGSIGTMTSEQGMSGAVDLPASVPDLKLKIYDSSGQLVRTLNMDGSGPGLVEFDWDGLDGTGTALPPGQYEVVCEGTLDDQTQTFDTYLSAEVTSVSVDPDQGSFVLITEEYGEVSFDEVRQIG